MDHQGSPVLQSLKAMNQSLSDFKHYTDSFIKTITSNLSGNGQICENKSCFSLENIEY